jgi:hypothetical protein
MDGKCCSGQTGQSRERSFEQRNLNPFGGETIGVAGAVALQQPMAFELAQVVAELI